MQCIHYFFICRVTYYVLWQYSNNYNILHLLHFECIVIDDCDPNPCLNGGNCTDGFDSFTCDGEDGYSGDTCEVNIDNCDPNLCQNGGTCIDGVNLFNCDCMEGYIGDACEIYVDDCDPNPCLNGGNCTDGVNMFTCDCVGDFTGDTCETGKCEILFWQYWTGFEKPV